MAWTDERVDVLKKLWVEGKSASFIAKKLGGVTRNAVIGKVHRLGLSNRTSTSLDKSKAKEKLPKKEKQAPASQTLIVVVGAPVGDADGGDELVGETLGAAVGASVHALLVHTG